MMATINPNLGPISTSTTVRTPAQAKPAAGESSPALPADGLNVDFSKAGGPAVEEKAAPQPTPEPAPQAPSAPAAIVVGGVELAAADGGFALSNTGGLAQLETPKAPEFSASIDGCLANLAASHHPEVADMLMGMQFGHLPASEADIKSVQAGGLGATTPTITSSQINWDLGADVVSSAQKFVIPVPQFADGGEPLVYPAGAKDKDGNLLVYTEDSKDKDGNSLAHLAGQPLPIMDWEGKPIGDMGVVFFNPKDQSWQAVKADGQGVVIMNQMTEDQGKALMDKIGADPGKLTLEQFKDVLTFAATTEYDDQGLVTREGCGDMYNSDRSFISKKMNAMETSETGIAQYGMFRRDDRDVCKVVFAEGPSEFEALTSGGVMVKQPIPEEGALLLRQPDGKGHLYRKIESQAFVETYKNKDGSAIELDKLPRHNI